MKQKNKKKDLIFAIILVIFFISLSKVFSYQDFDNIIKWYLMLILMTIAGLPLTLYLFDNFYDKGYIFSKVIGILLTGYIVWLLSSFKIIKFNYLSSLICTIITILASYIILYITMLKEKNNFQKIKNKIKINIFTILRIEIAFLAIFLIACYIKGFNPDVNSTEKFMDYGYMAIINKTDYMPPTDLWFSGKSINYYYFGQYISTFMSKLAKVKVNYGYNLMLITLFSLTFLESFSIAYNLLLKSTSKKTIKKRLLYIGGIIAGLSNTIAGNMHYVIYKIILPIINKNTSYYFPDSTRYIGYNPDTIDKTIHEFPSYSFILGDLHAHVINIIFVLLIIGLLLSQVIKTKTLNNKEEKITLKNTINLNIILIGILLGIYKMTNYWDFVIYIVVVILMFIFSNTLKYKKIKRIALKTIIQILTIIIFSTLISIPFMQKFNKMISGVKLVPYRTPIYQLLILWGLPILLVTYYAIIYIRKIKISKNKNIFKNILKYLYKFELTDLFMFILTLCAIGLIIIPEIVYVVDIYVGSVRANTMFKLTYQSYIMLSIGFGYFIIKILLFKEKQHKIVGSIFLLLFILTLGFSKTAANSWFGNLNNPDEYKTLNAMNFLQTNSIAYNMPEDIKDNMDDNVNMTDDLAVINWLNKHANNNSVIIEATGESYSFYNRISTFTGLATPMGWQTHEWLWRIKNKKLDMPKSVEKRINDVDTFYTTTDLSTIKKIIFKYNISYIIIGYTERIKYMQEDKELSNENKLKKLGNIVYETNNNNLNNAMYIIKVKK